VVKILEMVLVYLEMYCLTVQFKITDERKQKGFPTSARNETDTIMRDSRGISNYKHQLKFHFHNRNELLIGNVVS
jgi:hypothetical protein